MCSLFKVQDMVTNAISILAYVASSGLAATSVIIQTLQSGDHIVTMDDLYGGELLMYKHYHYTEMFH